MGKTGPWFSNISLGQSLMEGLFQHRELGLLPRVWSGTREVAREEAVSNSLPGV